jgi:hypothetical protein
MKGKAGVLQAIKAMSFGLLPACVEGTPQAPATHPDS